VLHPITREYLHPPIVHPRWNTHDHGAVRAPQSTRHVGVDPESLGGGVKLLDGHFTRRAARFIV
jgi:hypothetical protein